MTLRYFDALASRRGRIAALWLLLTALPSSAADLYVAADGTPAGPGSLSKPFDLETALSGAVGQAGDTFWLRGGTYSLGHVDTKVHGEPGKPLTFRSMPGEKPRVDGSFTIWNSIGHVVFRDFESFNSDPRRVSSQILMGFKPTDIAITAGIQAYAPNCHFINLVIHDHTRHGIYVSQLSNGNLIYSCLIYNNGWRSPDNAEGHALYIQGSSGMREISDNLLFNSAGVGMHVYDNGGQPVVGVMMDGNVAFNAGAIQNVRAYQDWVIGADSPSPFADQIVFKNNMGYRRPGASAFRRVEIGRDGVNGAVTMTDNYMPLGLLMKAWTSATVTGNLFARRDTEYAVDLQQGSNTLAATWNNNTYSCPLNTKGFRTNSAIYTFSEWQSATGFDASGTNLGGSLTGTKVFVRPNRYETGRAHLIVYNWNHLSTVPVDVSSLLPTGTAYEVRNAQDFFAAPVLSGTFNGQPLQLPMGNLSVAAPLGDMLTPPPTGPTFNVFVLLPATSLANPHSAPTISKIGDQTIITGTATAIIPFIVSDAETNAENLVVSGWSSNPTLVPASGIVFGGSGANRTVMITPAANRTGTAKLTVAVSDGSLSSNTRFVLSVNPPPTIALVSPAIGASFAAPATLGLAANVNPNGHTITKVEFYHGATVLGEDTTAPYHYIWSNIGIGSYSLNARAVFGASNTVASLPVHVTVGSASPSGLTLGVGSGTITAPFVVTNGTISQSAQTSVTDGGRATYSFALSTAGDYVVSTLVNAPDDGANSFFVNLDAEPTDPSMIWDIPLTSGLAERTVSWRGNGTFDHAQFVPKVFTLSAGSHTLIVRGREANTRLSSLSIVPYRIVLTFPATVGVVNSPFTITDDTVSQTTFTGATNGGRAAYHFTLSRTGDYLVSAQVDAADESANSFFVNIDAEPTDPTMIWDIPVTSGLSQRAVSWRGNGDPNTMQSAPQVFHLTAGTHILIVRGREANCRLGTITIAPYTIAPPSNLRVLLH